MASNVIGFQYVVMYTWGRVDVLIWEGSKRALWSGGKRVQQVGGVGKDRLVGHDWVNERVCYLQGRPFQARNKVTPLPPPLPLYCLYHLWNSVPQRMTEYTLSLRTKRQSLCRRTIQLLAPPRPASWVCVPAIHTIGKDVRHILIRSTVRLQHHCALFPGRNSGSNMSSSFKAQKPVRRRQSHGILQATVLVCRPKEALLARGQRGSCTSLCLGNTQPSQLWRRRWHP